MVASVGSCAGDEELIQIWNRANQPDLILARQQQQLLDALVSIEQLKKVIRQSTQRAKKFHWQYSNQ